MNLQLEKRAAVLYCLSLAALAFLALRLYALSDGNESQNVLGGQYTRKLEVVSHGGFVYDRNLSLLSHKKDGSVILVNPAGLDVSAHRAASELSEVCETGASDISSAILSGEILLLNSSLDANEINCPSGVYAYDRYEETNDIAVHMMGYSDADGNGVCGLKKAYQNTLFELSADVCAKYDANALSDIMQGGNFTVIDDGYSSSDGIVLTIDKELQQFTDSLEGEYIERGAVIVSDVNTGEILALSSYPSYDTKNVAEYLSSDRAELVNRAETTFTPGSVFKLIVAAAALETDESLLDFEYSCTGNITVADASYGCHKKSGHGTQTLEQAFANSCNTYFVSLARQIGLEAILDTAEKFGVGSSVCADFLCSQPANLPDRKNSDEKLLANISFGQGPLLMSPLDFVNVASACSTGYISPLSAVRGVYSGGELKECEKSGRKRVLSEKTVEAMRSMMRKCVTDGTGNAAFVEGVCSGGKTATAQTGQINEDGTEILHKWFCGVYPIFNPKYSVVVLCDGTGKNASNGAEIYGIVNKYLVNRGFVRQVKK